MVHPNIYNSKEVKYDLECTLKICNILSPIKIINLYPEKYYRINEDDIDELFYFYFKSDKANNIIFFDKVKRGNYRYPLVLCPYEKWISKNSLAIFKPSIYVKKEFPTITNDYDYHRYIPVFKSTQTGLGEGFICGEIIQINELPPIKIGFGIEEGLPMNIGHFKVVKDKNKKEEYFCDGIKLESMYIYAFHSKYNNFTKNLLRLVRIEEGVYSGEILFAYSKNEINDTHFNVNSNDLYFNKKYRGYDPVAVCRVKDLQLQYRLMIDGNIQEPIKSNQVNNQDNELYDTYIISSNLVNSKKYISCYGMVNDNETLYYNKLYSKTTKTFITKIENIAGHQQLGSRHEKIEIRNDIYNVLGKYKCHTNNSEIFNIIKTTYIVIVAPAKNVYQFNTTVSKDTKSPIFCPPKDVKHDELVEMKVIKNKNLPILLNVTDVDKDSRFKKDKDGRIIFNDSNDLSNYYDYPITIECIYGTDNRTRITIIKVIHFNGDIDEISNLNTLLRDIAFGWIGFMLVILLILIIRTVMKKKRSSGRRTLTTESDSRTLENNTTNEMDDLTMPTVDTSIKRVKK